MYSAAKNQTTDEERYSFYDSGHFDIEGGKNGIIQGALRVMASRIVGQDRQEQNAESLMFKGIERLRQGREQSAKYYSSPKFMAQRKHERGRQRTEVADRQRERVETAKPSERQQQVEMKTRVRGTERSERRIESTKKIGIYDALEEQQARARKPKADPKMPK